MNRLSIVNISLRMLVHSELWRLVARKIFFFLLDYTYVIILINYFRLYIFIFISKRTTNPFADSTEIDGKDLVVLVDFDVQSSGSVVHRYHRVGSDDAVAGWELRITDLAQYKGKMFRESSHARFPPTIMI